ncbi:UTRA domain-containing protein [Oceanimonas baumannii]|uniref:Transcriptional regulator n=1 Tax=Oceanimonas baumannii TaxID=129578 RepID=A0A235CHV7_9GAMM|nr:UTRA domain-containing protein [Oceanimonas baumannii]OYD23617.1 transcriptional regulator [Oceanimonas baumannii]TDW56840.1 DNA-binding GntR family transcriptional regulator [Oceanimonas baumannii]
MSKPHYQQISDSIEAQIRSGALLANSKLPSERQLSDAFATTRVTLREALSRLEGKGLIYRANRRGWYITPSRINYNPTQRLPFNEVVSGQGRRPDTHILAQQLAPAEPAVHKALGLAPLTPLHRVRRLRSIDGHAVLLEENHLDPARFPGLERHDLSRSLTRLFEQEYGVRIATMELNMYPLALDEERAQALGVATGAAALFISRLSRDEAGRVIELDWEYWRHDALNIQLSV